MVLGDNLKKVLLAGIGTVATTAEKAKEILDEMVKKGEITVEQSKVLNKELSQNLKETIKNRSAKLPKSVDELKDLIRSLTPEQLKDLKRQIDRVDEENSFADDVVDVTDDEPAAEAEEIIDAVIDEETAEE